MQLVKDLHCQMANVPGWKWSRPVGSQEFTVQRKTLRAMHSHAFRWAILVVFSDFSEIGGKEAHRNYANYFIKGNFPANHGTPPSIVCRYQLRLGKYLPKKNNNNNQPTTMEMSSEYL